MAEFQELVLKYTAETMRQRDVERLMASIRKSKLGDTTSEHNGKVLRAAVEAGWIETPVLTVDGVADMHPSIVTLYARQIDALYAEATSVPKA